MLIVEFAQTRELLFPQPFALLPDPYHGRALVAVAFALAVLLFLSNRLRRAGGDAPRPAFGSGRWLGTAAVLFFATGCFVHYYAVSDEVAVNLEHAWNLFHSGRFSMSPAANVDGSIELIFYALHTPFAGTLEHLVLANFVLTLLFSLGSVWLLHRWFVRLPSAADHTWMFLVVVFPLVRTYANGFGASFFCFLLLMGSTLLLEGATRGGRALAILLPLVRPEGVLWSLSLLLSEAPSVQGWKKRLREVFARLAVLLLAIAAFYAFFFFYYGHFKPTPVLNKTLSIAGYLNLFNPGDWHDQTREFVETGGGLVLLGAIAMVLAHWNAIAPSKRLLLAAGLGTALFYFAYFSVGSASIGWYGNQGFRYYAPTLSFAVLALLVAAAARAEPFKTRSATTVAALLLAVPVTLGMKQESPVYSDTWVNRQWAARAGHIASEVVAGTDLNVATSEMNTFGLMIADRAVEDYWTYTDRDIASSKLCSGDRTHWKARDAQFPNRFDLFWVYFTSLRKDDLFPKAELELEAFHHFSKGRGYKLGDLPDVMKEFDLLLIRLRSGETVAFLARASRGELIARRLQSLGVVATRSREADIDAVRKRWDASSARTQPC